MLKFNSKLMAGAALSAVLLAGCGGGDDDGAGSGRLIGGATPLPAQQTISNVFEYISQPIASADANSDPIDINALTLAGDEVSAPSLLN